MRVTDYDTEIFGTSVIFVGAPGYGHEHVARGGAERPAGSFSFRDGMLVGAVLLNPREKEVWAVREIIGMRDACASRNIDLLTDPSSDLAALVEDMKGI
jgi:hypothetical protein